MVIRKGEIIFTHTSGYADLEHDILVTEATNFRLASVTKQFTASAILILLQQSKLSLDDTLEMFFPTFPTYGKKITVYQLLTHTSGLIDYEELLGTHEHHQIHDKCVLEMLMLQDHDYFVPGKGYSYSNGGYCLLKLIIEKVSGKTYGEFLRDHIFSPLGMKDTIVAEGSVIKNRAYGYSLEEHAWVRTDQDATSATTGDGGIYSSIADLYRWDQSLYTHSVLSKKSIKEMFGRHVLSDEDEKNVQYGMGFFLKEHHDRYVEYHGGSSIGFRTGIYRIPEEQLTVLFLSNRNDAEGSVICEQIADSILDS